MDVGFIEKTIKQVMAVLGEARCYPRTGRTAPGLGITPDNATIASLIDHTLLKPDATARQIETLCHEALQYGFASVCVNSVYVPLVAAILKDKPPKVCAVVGFPLGAALPQVKTYEAQEALRHGASEIDMVLHIGALKNRDYVALHDDISDVALVAHDHDALCKVIIETALLTEEEKIIACQIIKVAGADFVKTSTGFAEVGATVADIALLRQIAGEGVGIKAAGGIHDFATAQMLRQAGANRLGTHAGVKIARQESGETDDKISIAYY